MVQNSIFPFLFHPFIMYADWREQKLRTESSFELWRLMISISNTKRQKIFKKKKKNFVKRRKKMSSRYKWIRVLFHTRTKSKNKLVYFELGTQYIYKKLVIATNLFETGGWRKNLYLHFYKDQHLLQQKKNPSSTHIIITLIHTTYLFQVI